MTLRLYDHFFYHTFLLIIFVENLTFYHLNHFTSYWLKNHLCALIWSLLIRLCTLFWKNSIIWVLRRHGQISVFQNLMSTFADWHKLMKCIIMAFQITSWNNGTIFSFCKVLWDLNFLINFATLYEFHNFNWSLFVFLFRKHKKA